MTKLIINITLSFALIFTIVNIQAQENINVPLELQASAFVENQQVLLRWAPLNSMSWELGNEEGYRVDRFMLVDENDVILPVDSMGASGIILTNYAKPIPEAEWEALANISDNAAIAAAALYGERFDVAPVDTSDYTSVFGATKESENRFGFGLFAADQEFEVAKNMGLALIDSTVINGATYMYRISFVATLPDSVKVRTTLSVKIETQDSTFIAPQELELVSGDSTILLSWSANLDNPYSSYVVERGTDGTSFAPVSNRPIVYTSGETESDRIFFSDELPDNNQTFHYRVKGKNAFGLFGPYSDVIQGQGQPVIIDGPLKITETILNPDSTNTINWSLPTEQESEISGFRVMRSNLRNGIYEEISTSLLAANQRTFSDTDPLGSSYYRVVAVDVYDREITSLASLVQLEDTTPPAIPTGIEGTCSTSGAITLEWNENTDPDIMGYRVFVSNQPTGMFTQVSASWLRNPIFYYQVDMNNAAEEIYFKVVALDHRENASDFSEPALVERPDIHPPSPPAIKTIDAQAGGVLLTYEPSTADDVVEHSLERKPAYNNNWTEILRFEDTTEDLAFLDSTATENTLYTYRLLAIDDANLRSSSLLKSISPLTSTIIDGITDLYGEIFTNKKKVFLSWNYSYHDLIHSFDIYRSVDSDTYRHFKTVKKDDAYTALISGAAEALDNVGEYIYEDTELISQTRIKYKVQVQYVDGRSSKLSAPVILLIQ